MKQTTPEERKPTLVGTVLLLTVMLTWVFAFAPEPWAAATIPGFVAYLALIERAPTLRNAWKLCLVFGALTLGCGYYWLAQTVHEFGGLPLSAGIACASLFGIVGTVHAMIFIPAHRALLSRGRRPHPITTAVLWVACECLPIRMFAWMAGNGAVDTAPLVQQAEWGGVPGVSLVLMFLVVPIHEWLRWAFARSGPPARPVAALVTFAVGLAFFGWGVWRYGDVLEEERNAPDRIRVGIVQANVGSSAKRDGEKKGVGLDKQIIRYYQGSQRAVADKAEDGRGVDLIVWPETALTAPIPFWKAADGWALVDGYLTGSKTWWRWRDPETNELRFGYPFLREIGAESVAFLIGCYEEHIPPRSDSISVDQQARMRQERYKPRYNVAALRQPGGPDAEWSVVRKVELIPFGEDVPFEFLREFLPQDFRMHAGDRGQPPFVLREKVLVPFLCYEGILPDHVLAAAGGQKADLLVSLTNDSWFGDTWEPFQHLNLTRFRAVEHRAPLVRATNTGISAFVSATGDVTARTELGFDPDGPGGFTEDVDVLVEDVPLVGRDRTWFTRFGYRLPWVLYAWSFLVLLLTALRPPPPVLPSS